MISKDKIIQDKYNEYWYELDLSPEHRYSIYDRNEGLNSIYCEESDDRFMMFWDGKEIPKKVRTLEEAIDCLEQLYLLVEPNLLDKEI